MRIHVAIIVLFIFTGFAKSQYKEPSGGLYPTNLEVFRDELNKRMNVQFWGIQSTLDNAIVKNGKASWKLEAQNNSGMHILWGDWSLDTTVFWVSDRSYLSFWIRPDRDNITFSIQLGFMGGEHDVITQRVVGIANTWKYYDLIVPRAAVGRPLNDIKVVFWDVKGEKATIHIDDLRITNVRLYAGRGETESITGVFADQIGYDTFGIKTFSSEKFKSFNIVRASDNKVLYTGTESRQIASRVVNDYSVFIGDFTSFRTPGKYYIQLDNGKKSFPFEIGSHVYDSTLRAAIRFFYYQRNNTAIEMPYAEGPWVHPKDEKDLVLLPRSQGGTKYVRKGWHDAGDLAIYMPNHTYACFWLAKAWDDYRFDADNLNIPESGNGVPDLLDELRWGLDWILDMQDTDGGFFQNMCVLRNSPYTYGRTTPNTITGYELTNKTTAATATASAMLAYASTIYSDKKLDPAYAARMLSAARKGWQWLQKHPNQILITEACDTYQDDSDIHARFWAACGLFLATGEEQFHQFILKNDPGSQWISDYNNQTNLGYLLYVNSPKGNKEKQKQLHDMLVGRAAEANADREKHPFGFVGYYYWGSLGTSFARVGNYNLYDWNVNKNRTSLFTALQQLHYTFGQNSLNFCYFSNFGSHGMRHAFHHWLKALNATPFTFPGMLPGGPNENPDPNDRTRTGYNKPTGTPIDQRYTDNDSWSTNEIAVNQSAQLVYVLCAAQAFAREKR